MRPAARLGLAALAFAGLVALAAALFEPRGDRAAAEAALDRWRSLPGSAEPHALGSPAHKRLGDALERLFASFELESAHQSTPDGLRNFVARRLGSSDLPPVVLMAHWDSVAAGPGAADDGAGMSVLLELAARSARLPKTPLRTTIFLATDGEEAGLLGAKAFLATHPWAQSGGILINMEARGTSGPVLLFETIGNQQQLIDAARGALDFPAAFSLAAEIYERMPNDTDLSVFKGAPGWHGYNLAFIRGLEHYHTARDDAEHLSPESVAHLHSSARALLEYWQQHSAGQDFGNWEPRARAPHTSLFGSTLVVFPSRARWPMTLALTLFGILMLGRSLRAWLGGWLVLAVSAGAALALTRLDLASAWAGGAAAWLATALALEARAAVGLLLVLNLLSALFLPAALPQTTLPLLAALVGEALRRILLQSSPLWWAVPMTVVTTAANAPVLLALGWVQGHPGGPLLGLLWALLSIPWAVTVHLAGAQKHA
jgi:hypothetical protein